LWGNVIDNTALLALQSSIREKFIIESRGDGLLVIESTGVAILANTAYMFNYQVLLMVGIKRAAS
tara:strand:- start:1514 stop:1708 length:195 start_codon:yes stop_codon:yes gene_type:complete